MMMVRTDPQDEKFREFFDNGWVQCSYRVFKSRFLVTLNNL